MREIRYKFLDGKVVKVMVEDDLGETIIKMNTQDRKKEKLIRANEVFISDLTKDEYMKLNERESDKNLEELEENNDEI